MPGQNLVVCPLSVLYNWSEQLKLHAPSLKVRTYHGADRDLPLQDDSSDSFIGDDGSQNFLRYLRCWERLVWELVR